MNKRFCFDTVQRQRSHPSLFPLRMILFTAELDTPAQPPCPPSDPDELLAISLIEKIRNPQPVSFADVRIESPQPFQHQRGPLEMESVNA